MMAAERDVFVDTNVLLQLHIILYLRQTMLSWCVRFRDWPRVASGCG